MKKKHFLIILKVATNHLNVFLVIFKLRQPRFLDLSKPGFRVPKIGKKRVFEFGKTR